MFLTLLFDHPTYYFVVVAVVLVSVVLHELCHALAATWEGDPTPSIRGHMTWNPVVHMGWFAIGLLCVVGITFGRTPVTPARFRHRRWGETIVALAGPAANLLLAFVATFVVAGLRRTGALSGASGAEASLIGLFWDQMLWMNVVLFLINLIPLPPLDGFAAAQGAFDLGNLGAWLRSMGYLPLIVAILIVNTRYFDAAVSVVSGLIGAPARIVLGTG